MDESLYRRKIVDYNDWLLAPDPCPNVNEDLVNR